MSIEKYSRDLLSKFFVLQCNLKLLIVFQGDVRRYIALSTFGFLREGYLDVNLTEFRVEDGRTNETVR